MEWAALSSLPSFLWSYQRNNYLYDVKIGQERDLMNYEFRVRLYELYREDLRMFWKFTHLKMENIQILATVELGLALALYLEFRPQVPEQAINRTILVLFTAAVSASSSFLLLAVWFSVQCGLAAHADITFMKVAQTRLPIPESQTLEAALAKADKFEEDAKGKDYRRVPFVGVTHPGVNAPFSSMAHSVHSQQNDLMNARFKLGNLMRDRNNLVRFQMAHSMKALEHIRGVKELQAFWINYDIYARICMSIGSFAFFHSLAFYCVFAIEQADSQSAGTSCTILLGLLSIVLIHVDMLQTMDWKSHITGFLFVLPLLLAVIIATIETEDLKKGACVSIHLTVMESCTFIAEAAWYCWIWGICTPLSNGLPAHYRNAIMFLDLFDHAGIAPRKKKVHSLDVPKPDAHHHHDSVHSVTTSAAHRAAEDRLAYALQSPVASHASARFFDDHGPFGAFNGSEGMPTKSPVLQQDSHLTPPITKDTISHRSVPKEFASHLTPVVSKDVISHLSPLPSKDFASHLSPLPLKDSASHLSPLPLKDVASHSKSLPSGYESHSIGATAVVDHEDVVASVLTEKKPEANEAGSDLTNISLQGSIDRDFNIGSWSTELSKKSNGSTAGSGTLKLWDSDDEVRSNRAADPGPTDDKVLHHHVIRRRFGFLDDVRDVIVKRRAIFINATFFSWKMMRIMLFFLIFVHLFCAVIGPITDNLLPNFGEQLFKSALCETDRRRMLLSNLPADVILNHSEFEWPYIPNRIVTCQNGLIQHSNKHSLYRGKDRVDKFADVHTVNGFLVEGGNVYRVDGDDVNKRRVGRIPLKHDVLHVLKNGDGALFVTKNGVIQLNGEDISVLYANSSEEPLVAACYDKIGDDWYFLRGEDNWKITRERVG